MSFPEKLGLVAISMLAGVGGTFILFALGYFKNFVMA